VTPKDSDLPAYQVEEIIESPSYDESESFDICLQINKLDDLINIESVAWMAFSVQLARYSPEEAFGVTIRAVPFNTMLEDVQMTTIECEEVSKDVIEVSLRFHWVRRFSDSLKLLSTVEEQVP